MPDWLLSPVRPENPGSPSTLIGDLSQFKRYFKGFLGFAFRVYCYGLIYGFCFAFFVSRFFAVFCGFSLRVVSRGVL
jgi:hypothetical protein